MPQIFIASSVEGLPIARAIRANLDHDAEVVLWNEGVFRPSRWALHALLDALSTADVGVFVCSPDDVADLRGEEVSVVRDNVILELGMSLGRLGPERTFIVQPRDTDLHLPTDLSGITPLTYDSSRLERPRAALGAASDEIRDELRELTQLLPEQGEFGENMLYPERIDLESGAEYSLSARVPEGESTRVRITLVESDREGIPWSMSIGPSHGFRAQPSEDDSQEFSNVGHGLLHTPISFDGDGRARVQVWKDDEELLDKEITWS